MYDLMKISVDIECHRHRVRHDCACFMCLIASHRSLRVGSVCKFEHASFMQIFAPAGQYCPVIIMKINFTF